MDSVKIRVLCISFGAAGHLNPILGLGTELLKRGHEVVIATERSWAGKFVKLGFKEELFDEKEQSETKPGKQFVEIIQRMAPLFRAVPIERVKNISTSFFPFMELIKFSNKRVAQIIESTKPDVIIYENLLWHPAVLKAKVPIVYLQAGNPLVNLEGNDLPPATSGLSLNAPTQEWTEYRKVSKEVLKEVIKVYNSYLDSEGAMKSPYGLFGYLSANLNIFVYPKALAKRYLDRSTMAHHWIGIDHALRPNDRDFHPPVEFMSLPGRLLYMSMGSLASSDVDLMNTLVGYLGKAKGKYKCIVSRGMLSNRYQLADNMWGEDYVPQLGALPLVDLAIIHGGNNSFVETLYFGKPMIVMPMFAEQPDNAQMAVEAKVGAIFNPFKQTGDELIELIDRVLADPEIKSNVQMISKKMQASTSMQEAVDKIEYVARNPIYPGIISR